MQSFRAVVSCVLMVVMLLGSSAAHAAPGTDALIAEGIELRKKGQDAAALERFREAYKLDGSPRSLAQMGLAQQALGYWMIAGRNVQRALQAQGDPWIRKNRAALEQALTIIHSRLGELEISGSPAGAEVRVDGEVIGKLPFTAPLRVSLGTVVVDVRADGFVTISRPVQVASGVPGREHFALQPTARPLASTEQPDSWPSETPTSEPTAEPPAAASEWPLRTLAWTAAGAAAVATGWGIYEYLVLQDRKDEYDLLKCTAMDSTRCREVASDGTTAQTLMFVGFGLAAALTATSVVLFLSDKPAKAEGVAFGCFPQLTGVGAQCALRF